MTSQLPLEDGQDTGATPAALVAVTASTHLLAYAPPRGGRTTLAPGMRVEVPLRGGTQVGVVWALTTAQAAGCPAEKLRPIRRVLDEAPLWSEALRETLDFVARYYHVPVGLVARTALPVALRRLRRPEDPPAEKRVQIAEPVDGVAWPVDLRAAEARVLQRLAAEGPVPVAALRKRARSASGPVQRVSVPQTMLESLQERGLLRLRAEVVQRDPLGLRSAAPPDTPPTLRPAQQTALDACVAAFDAGEPAAFLLQGVTGSGKTEVYVRLIAHVLERTDRGAIVLVPEIALTPQLVTRFRARLGDTVAVLHSAMSEGERHDQMRALASGQRRVAVGPRSALFAPIMRLGVVVVDECHDGSYKQGSGVRYHARDVALVLARAAGAVCVFGTATPGCDERALVDRGALRRLELPERATGRPMPAVQVIDLKETPRLQAEGGGASMWTRPLLDAIEETVRRGEQAIVLHNRRGFSQALVCRRCGEPVNCPDCAVSLTLHQRHRRLRCHLCDHTSPAAVSCVHCGSDDLIGVGAGTEKVEARLIAELPKLRVARFDRDTASGARMLATLERFRRRELDVLVGTQMLAKGHDFPRVTLVAILLAETGLRIPDFRAAERTYQLLTQVSGRAGRAERPGRVIVQTWAPDEPAIRCALNHDLEGFLQAELRDRQATWYPPACHLALVETSHTDERRAGQACSGAVEVLRAHGLEVRGPLPAGIARLRGQHRFHALVRSSSRAPLHRGLAAVERTERQWSQPGVRLVLDVDPQSFA